MQTIEARAFLLPQEKHQTPALELYESAVYRARIKSGHTLDTHTYYPSETKPYLHFTDFIHEQGDKPLLDLVGYVPFLSRLLSNHALDLVEHVPNTVDKEDTVWSWFANKAHGLSLQQLAPFAPVIEQKVFERPLQVWAFLYPKIEHSRLQDLTSFADILKNIVTIAGTFKQKKYSRVVQGEVDKPPTENELLFEKIDAFFLEKLPDAHLDQIAPLSKVVEYLLVCRDVKDERLADILRAMMVDVPFQGLAKYAQIIGSMRMPSGTSTLVSNWEWFTQQTEGRSLQELEAWMTYIAARYSYEEVAEWFMEKSKDATAEQLHPWVKVVELLELSSRTKGQGIQFFMDRLSDLPLEQLSGWKSLFENVWDHDDALRIYTWLRSKIFTGSGVDVERMAEWQTVFARLAWKGEPELLTCMFSDLAEYTETIEEWRATHEWVEALVQNLHEARNSDGSKNTPGNESPGRKAFLFLWESFTQAVGENAENAHEFGSLLWAFENSQSYYRLERKYTEDGWEGAEDFEHPRKWIRKQLSAETQLNQVETWQHMLARNDHFFEEQLLNMFAQSTLEEVRQWRSYISSAVQTLMGGERYNSTTSRIELLVQFSEEVTQHFSESGQADFAELYVRFRDFVMRLNNAEASMLRSMVRMKGILNHTMMSVVDGKPFALELAKTGGRLFVWSEGDTVHGATITNMVTPTSYKAWRKAHDLHVPVTPILSAREIDEKVSVPELFRGTMLVDTRAVGVQVSELSHQTKQLLHEEIEQQKSKIRNKLKRHSIRYTNQRLSGHDRDHNYLIELVERKHFTSHGGWRAVNTIPYSAETHSTDFTLLSTTDTYDPKTSPWVAVVRLVDWDHAFLKEDEGQVDTRFEPNHNGEGFATVMC